MLDFLPAKIFPPALLGGIVTYGLIVMLWLQPLVESRMAIKTFIPQCETNLNKIEVTKPAPNNSKRLQFQMMMEMFKGSGLNKIPMISQSLEVAKRQLQAIQPKQYRSSLIERTSVCSCSVDKAFAEYQLRMTLHVASLRTHVPNALKSMNQTVLNIAASGQCGKLPFMKG